jgi:hypothetical protein
MRAIFVQRTRHSTCHSLDFKRAARKENRGGEYEEEV